MESWEGDGMRSGLYSAVSNARSEIVWLPLASIASTSNFYSVPGSRNSAGTVTLVASGPMSAVKILSFPSSVSTTMW